MNGAHTPTNDPGAHNDVPQAADGGRDFSKMAGKALDEASVGGELRPLLDQTADDVDRVKNARFKGSSPKRASLSLMGAQGTLDQTSRDAADVKDELQLGRHLLQAAFANLNGGRGDPLQNVARAEGKMQKALDGADDARKIADEQTVMLAEALGDKSAEKIYEEIMVGARNALAEVPDQQGVIARALLDSLETPEVKNSLLELMVSSARRGEKGEQSAYETKLAQVLQMVDSRMNGANPKAVDTLLEGFARELSEARRHASPLQGNAAKEALIGKPIESAEAQEYVSQLPEKTVGWDWNKNFPNAVIIKFISQDSRVHTMPVWKTLSQQGGKSRLESLAKTCKRAYVITGQGMMDLMRDLNKGWRLVGSMCRYDGTKGNGEEQFAIDGVVGPEVGVTVGTGFDAINNKTVFAGEKPNATPEEKLQLANLKELITRMEAGYRLE